MNPVYATLAVAWAVLTHVVITDMARQPPDPTDRFMLASFMLGALGFTIAAVIA